MINTLPTITFHKPARLPTLFDDFEKEYNCLVLYFLVHIFLLVVVCNCDLRCFHVYDLHIFPCDVASWLSANSGSEEYLVYGFMDGN